ncbi:MAG: MBL fold metallo-hydrolase [Myxococcota bacterium]
MITEVRAGPYTIRGISVAGVYTTLQVPELDVVLDVGIPLRSFASTDRIFLSHGHGDHASALASLLGIRDLMVRRRARVFLPAEIEHQVAESLALLSKLHRNQMDVELVPVRPGETFNLGRDLWVRALRTHHPVPSLGYQFLRKVKKLKAELRELPQAEIAALRRAGRADLFEESERLELAYCTDTLSRVVETSPSVLESRVLILECTYVNHDHTVEDARRRAHIHLDEIVARADLFRNEHLVLMHFSQSHSPATVHATVRERVPESLRDRVVVFAPTTGGWPG